MLLKNYQTRFCQLPPFSPYCIFNYLERVLQLLLSKKQRKWKEKTLKNFLNK